MDCLRHRILALFVVGCITLTLSSVQTSARQTQPGASPAASSARAVFDKYCITCHNQKLHTAGLELDSLDTANPVAHAEALEKVIAKLRAGSMPPPGIRNSPAREPGRPAERRSAARLSRGNRDSPRLPGQWRIPHQSSSAAAISGLHQGHGMVPTARRPPRWHAAEAIYCRRQS